MPVFSGFRTRSADRDRKTDLDRWNRLEQVAVQLREDLDRELTGLSERQAVASRDAASLAAAADNDGHSGADTRIDQLTDTIKQCDARLAELRGQLAIAEDIAEKAARARGAITGRSMD